VRGASASINALSDLEQWPTLDDFGQWMMFLDAVTYLPDDILAKVDRAAMASSLESRMPILDRRVVEFAWSLPREMKFARGEGKRLMREILHRHVPRDLVDRPKMGFGVPIDAWLRGPLRDWAETLLAERRLDEEGFLAPAIVRGKWLEHLSGHRDWRYLLWDVLMFQGWLEEERRHAPAEPGGFHLGQRHGPKFFVVRDGKVLGDARSPDLIDELLKVARRRLVE
jgi:asparagine synthase (glutamine-hydrolysing)